MKIHRFARVGDIAGVAGELAAGVSVDAVEDSKDITPLMYAAESSAAGVDMVRYLIEQGADVNASGGNYSKEPVAWHAVKGMDIAKVRVLIDAGADIKRKTDSGYDIITSTMYAHAYSNDDNLSEFVHLFIEKGVTTDVVSSFGETAVGVASSNGRFDVVRLLVDNGADAEQLMWTELMNAVIFGMIEDVRGIIDKGCDLSVCDCWSRTAWLLSIQVGDIAKCKLLLDAGSERGEKGHRGKTPLMYAVTNQRLDMLRWLLDEGFDTEDTDDFSSTALHEACEKGYTDCVEILLEYSAAIETVSPGKTFAEQGNDIEALLAESGMDAKEVKDLFEGLSDLKADAEEIEDSVEKAISVASNLAIVRLLVEAGADLNDINNEMRDALTGTETNENLQITMDEYLSGKTPKYGGSNPEMMNVAFWEKMIKGGVCNFDTCVGTRPVWRCSRFGKSITEMPDGRIIEIAGEHEDSYMPDFYIYNDVVVHHGNGEVTIYGYPKEVFGPTDFHTATLVGGFIYIIGCLGYPENRVEGITPVYRLDCDSFAIEKVDTCGEQPGCLSGHKAFCDGGSKIRITGGKIFKGERFCANENTFVLNLSDMRWGCQ